MKIVTNIPEDCHKCITCTYGVFVVKENWSSFGQSSLIYIGVGVQCTAQCYWFASINEKLPIK